MKQALSIFCALITFSIFGQNPVASYYFNGNTNDKSGNDYHANNYGATLTYDRFGDSLSAFYFDGIDDYIEIPFSEPFNFGEGDFAISLWFKPSNAYQMGMLLQKGGKYEYAAPGYWLRFNDEINGNNMTFLAGNGIGSSSLTGANNSYTKDEWYHIVAQRSQGYLQIFVNGKQEANSYSYPQDVNDDSNILIGAQGLSQWNSDFIRHFYGAIDDINLYDSALDSCTVNRLYWESKCKEVVYIYDTVKVTVYDTVLIAVTDTLYIDVPSVTINEEEVDVQIKLFPNPTKDILTIQNSSILTSYKLDIYNTIGQKVYCTNITESSHQVNLELLGGAGSYIVKLYNESGQLVSTKIIILK